MVEQGYLYKTFQYDTQFHDIKHAQHLAQCLAHNSLKDAVIPTLCFHFLLRNVTNAIF